MYIAIKQWMWYSNPEDVENPSRIAKHFLPQGHTTVVFPDTKTKLPFRHHTPFQLQLPGRLTDVGFPYRFFLLLLATADILPFL